MEKRLKQKEYEKNFLDFNNPFKKKGNWYKGCLHIHTTNSDGTLSPEEICKIYKNSGYDFISITDHNKITITTNTNSFLLISGIELNSEKKGEFHVLCIGAENDIDVKGLYPQEIINAINPNKCISIIAHPYWSAISSSYITELSNWDGIEIYNNTCEKRWGKGYTTVHWDEILQNGKKCLGFAVDDVHYHKLDFIENDILGSFIMVKARNLSKDKILESIKNGYFYSSTGPFIKNFEIYEKKIYIKTSPVSSINFIGYGWTGQRFSGKGKKINEIEYQIKGDEKYIRVEITDKENKKAWTNPIYLKE